MKKILGEIEEQIVTVLQKYHLKNEAKILEEAMKDGGSTTSSSPGRPSSQSVKLRGDHAASAVPGDAPSLDDSGAQGAPTHSNASGGAVTAASEPSSALDSDCAGGSHKTVSVKAVGALVSKDQPYRYGGLRPPHLSLEELKKKDNVEEEYPLTYDELKVKVWHIDGPQ